MGCVVDGLCCLEWVHGVYRLSHLADSVMNTASISPFHHHHRYDNHQHSRDRFHRCCRHGHHIVVVPLEPALGLTVPPGGAGGGVHVSVDASSNAAPLQSNITFTSVIITHNVAGLQAGSGSGDGGGIYISAPSDTQRCPASLAAQPYYREYDYATLVSLSDCLVIGNAADCKTCNGGGLMLFTGAYLVLTATSVSDNAAGQFGGTNVQTHNSTACLRLGLPVLAF